MKKNEQILHHIISIEHELNLLKKSLYLNPEKYEIIAIHRDGFSFLCTSDHIGNRDFIWIVASEKIEEERMIKGVQAALNKLNWTHEDKVTLYTDLPIEKLTEDFQKLLGVLEVSVEEVEDDLVELYRSEYAKDNS